MRTTTTTTTSAKKKKKKNARHTEEKIPAPDQEFPGGGSAASVERERENKIK